MARAASLSHEAGARDETREDALFIRTDTSHKYPPETFRALAAAQGWEPVRLWVDAEAASAYICSALDAVRETGFSHQPRGGASAR